MPATLEQAYAAHPEFRSWCHSLWANFSPRDRFCRLEERLQSSLGAWEPERLVSEIESWKERGILPHPDLEQQDWVGWLWSRPLYLALVETIGFTPGPEVDLRAFLPKPYPTLAYFGMVRTECHLRCQRGQLAEGILPYWQLALRLQAPHLYLTPFLGPGPKRGCDLACGWGRISLALPDYRQVQLTACDLSAAGLERLRRLAEGRGLDRQIETCCLELPWLPFPDDSFDFFLAFDIFEHLTRATLQTLLAEILRCARPGSTLYAEIPLLARCPALTHIQHWTVGEVRELFEGFADPKKRFRVQQWSPLVPEHFSLAIEAREDAPARG